MDRKTTLSWALYDWANSAINTVVFTFVFSVYFAKQVYGDTVAGSAAWSFAQGWAGLTIAILSPLLGCFIDRYGPRKPIMLTLTLTSVALTASLYFVRPDASYVFMALMLVGILTICFELAQNLYNTTLPLVAPLAKMGLVSGLGWGAGNIGSILCLGIVLVGFIGLGEQPNFFGVSSDDGMQVRVSLIFVALWFALFSIPFFRYCPDAKKNSGSLQYHLKAGLQDLRKTIQDARHYRELVKFLIASAVYRDGLTTLFAVGGLYTAGTLGMGFTQMMLFAIAINLTVGIGAFGMAFVEDRIGPKPVIIVSLVALLIFGGLAFSTDNQTLFTVYACILGLFIGSVQSASRTFVVALSPPEKVSLFFGLYALTGRSISFVGPFVFTALTTAFDSQRAGMASILGFWLVGLLLVYFVRSNRVRS